MSEVTTNKLIFTDHLRELIPEATDLAVVHDEQPRIRSEKVTQERLE